VVFSSWNGKVVDNRKTGKNTKIKPSVGLPTLSKGDKASAIVGWNGIIVNKAKANIPALLVAYLTEAHKLSCGECSVCSIGIEASLNIINGILAGKETTKKIGELEQIVNLVTENAKCNFGKVTALAPLKDALKYFQSEFVPAKQNTEKSDYKKMVTAPCMQACPAGLDIPGYIELIKNDRFADSLDLIRQKCILPGVIGRACTHPCEDACVRGCIDSPLAIRLLKRAVADAELKGGCNALSATVQKGEKIAVVGSGPAGLSAAYHLRCKGYQVTLFEALPKAGGMAAVGIPDYRLPKDILNYEIDLIKRMGVEIKLNSKIEKLNWKQLQDDGYKALYLAVGAHVGTKIGCAGEDIVADDFVQGADFLREIALGKKIAPQRRVAIIGGGNVAMDCARSCVRLGFKEVVVVYRRSEAEMPAAKIEIAEAKEEGIKFEFLKAPVSIVRKNDKLKGIECVKMKLGEPDASGRKRPVPVKGSEHILAVDMVISATGQKPELSFIDAKEKISTTDWGTIKVDGKTIMTNIKGVFAGGDCVSGAATLIEALH
ncbi:MAG: FAD-dependent oxidoreductase, partial [Deltaproteobacteria bacterium]